MGAFNTRMDEITMKPFSSLLLRIAIPVLLLTSCQSEPRDAQSGNTLDLSNQGQANVIDNMSDANILQIALNSSDHTTLAAAIEASDMQNILVSQGPLTVFAPNDAAFAKLPAGTVEELLKPENKSKLAKIITSHASPGTFKGDLLKPGTKIYLATGQYVDVEIKDGHTYVNGAQILGTVDASNGVVHVVDQVFLFPDM